MYYRPKTLDDALAIRAGEEVTLLAGGTDVFPARATDRAWGHVRQKALMDISALAELKGIGQRDGHWRIGALATWSELTKTPLPPVFDALKAAAREVGGVQIQNRGTIVGNICNASPAADGVPPLLCQDAEVVLASVNGERVLPLAEFITGNRETLCRADEIVTALRLPRSGDGARSAFFKLGSRRYLVISIVMAAGIAAVEEGVVTDLRLSVGACSAVACRLNALESELLGRSVGDALGAEITDAHLSGLAPIDDIRASADYRAASVPIVLRRLLQALLPPRERQAA